MAKKDGETQYHVLRGVDYISSLDGKYRRAEPGETVTDIIARDIKWLTEQGVITTDAPETEGDEG